MKDYILSIDINIEKADKNNFGSEQLAIDDVQTLN